MNIWNKCRATTWSYKAAMLELIRNYDAALESLSQAIQINPRDGYLFYRRGYIHLRKGHLDECIVDFTQVLTICRDKYVRLTARLERGFCYLWHKEFDKAQEDFENVLKTGSAGWRAFHGRAICHLLEDRCKPAVADEDKAIQMNPLSNLTSMSTECFVVRAVAQAKFNSKSARKDIISAIRLDDIKLSQIIYFAQVLLDYDKIDYYVLLAAMVLDERPNLASAHALYAVGCHRQGKLEEALKESSMALELDPRCATAIEVMGACMLGSKKFDEADRCYSTLLEIDPEDLSSLNNRDKARMGRNNHEGFPADALEACEIRLRWWA
ncbi:MAG: hypothetical protein K2Z81_00200 [Cyanobacteria bacterium]|nr:hypothetical protein [Cyanobacteriota bacterium]